MQLVERATLYKCCAHVVGVLESLSFDDLSGTQNQLL